MLAVAANGALASLSITLVFIPLPFASLSRSLPLYLCVCVCLQLFLSFWFPIKHKIKLAQPQVSTHFVWLFVVVWRGNKMHETFLSHVKKRFHFQRFKSLRFDFIILARSLRCTPRTVLKWFLDGAPPCTYRIRLKVRPLAIHVCINCKMH